MNAIRMVVIPLVMAVIFIGVARLGDLRKLGRLGGTTLGFYWITTPPAIVLGHGQHGLLPAFRARHRDAGGGASRPRPRSPGWSTSW